MLSIAPCHDMLFAPGLFRAYDTLFAHDVLARLARGLPASSQLRMAETDSGYSLEAELPGTKPSEIEVTIKGSDLIVTAKTDAKNGLTRRLNHRITLPADADADKAAASCENGVLHIELPKQAPAEPLAPFEIGLVEPDALPEDGQAHYRQTLHAPGVAPADLKITCTAEEISVEGRTEARGGRAYGIHRRFALPDDADTAGATAALTHGLLTLVVPRRPEPEPRLLPVADGASAEDDFHMC